MLPETQITKYAVQEFLVMTEDMMLINDLVLKNGWTDVEVFGKGDMISSPKIANHWKLIPANLYESTIPIEARQRVYLAHKAGVQIKGVVIADDERKLPKTTIPRHHSGWINPILQNADRAGFVMLKVLLGIAAVVVGAIVISALAAILLAIGLAVLVITGVGAALVYDPKCIILIDDGMGGTIWVSLYTWWD
jgi:hypothetical protein